MFEERKALLPRAEVCAEHVACKVGQLRNLSVVVDQRECLAQAVGNLARVIGMFLPGFGKESLEVVHLPPLRSDADEFGKQHVGGTALCTRAQQFQHWRCMQTRMIAQGALDQLQR